MLKLKELYMGQTERNAAAITNLTWDYGEPADVHQVAKEMNGYDLNTGKLLSSPSGRWHHELWQLAVVRHVYRGGQHGSAAGHC